MVLFSGGGENEALPFSFFHLCFIESSISWGSRCHTQIGMTWKGFIYGVPICRHVGIEEAEEIVQWPRAGVSRAVTVPRSETLREGESHVGGDYLERICNLRLKDMVSQR